MNSYVGEHCFFEIKECIKEELLKFLNKNDAEKYSDIIASSIDEHINLNISELLKLKRY